MKISKSSLLIKIVDTYNRGGSLIVCGNGGSATQSNHLAEELVGRYKKDRKPIKAHSLSSDVGIITCIANDYGFEKIFSRQLECMANDLDILICFSTSGKSPNIVKVMDKAISLGIEAVLITGNNYNEPLDKNFLFYAVDDFEGRRVQEKHLVLIHDIIEAIEENFI
tara:strand:+ start:240 stop:740 length:501 start_codon:yes stop_codon:yes gene_type:complete